MTTLELQNVNGYYGRSHIIHDVSLRVEDGDLVTLVGRNGAGKTTSLRSIMGVIRRTGTITIDGIDISGMEPHQIAKRGIAIIPEERRLFPQLTVDENLKTGHLGHDLEDDELAERFDVVFDLFPRLEERRDQQVKLMSGGEQQMVAIARALMSDPDLILVDEPTEGLMPSLVEKVRDVLQRINDAGVSILLVEQNVDLALGISDYAYVIDEGVIQREGPATDLLKDDEVRDKYLGLTDA